MTVLGNILPVNSKGVHMLDKSFLSKISYENSIRILKRRVPLGIYENIDNITKKLIVGSKPNVGTGTFKILKKQILNITYFNIEDEEKIEICYKNNTIKLNNNVKVRYEQVNESVEGGIGPVKNTTATLRGEAHNSSLCTICYEGRSFVGGLWPLW